MPKIPSINRQTPLANAAGAVLDRERRPTVDNRGVQRAVGDLAKAGKMPDVPMSLGENPGMQAIGKALFQAGDVLGAAAIQEQRSQTIVQASKAADALRNASVEFQGKMAGVDPAKWPEEFQKHSAPVLSRLLNDPNLTPAARDKIQLEAEAWHTASATQIKANSQITLNKQARDAILGEANNAIAEQNPEKFEAALKTGREEGLLFDHVIEGRRIAFKEEGERQRRQAKADQDRIEFEVNAGQAIQDPIRWKQENPTPWEGRETLWQKVHNVADGREREGSAEFIREVTDAIVSGDITWESEIDAWESPFKTPTLAEQAKRYLATRDEEEERRERDENGIRNAVEIRQRIKEYNPAGDPSRAQYFELAREIRAQVAPEMSNELTNDLGAKYGLPAALKPRPELQSNVTKSLDVTFDPRHGAIPWKKEVPVRDAKGRPVTDYNGNPKTEIQVDQAARQRAIDAQTVIETKMADWFRTNPEATLPEAKKKLNEVLPEGLRGAVMMMLQKKLEASQGVPSGIQPKEQLGKVTSYGYANDSTPDSNSKAGIGAFVPLDEQAKIKRGEPSDFKLRHGDIAVSPDIEKAFKAQGIEPMGVVMLQLANGEVRRARWADRTAQDSDVSSGRIKGVTQPLRGRFDFYSPSGVHEFDGMRVVRWWKPENEVAGL